MKKVLFLLALSTMIATLSHAQMKHLEFLGVPIDGEYETFVNKMIAKGFEKGDKENILYGTFFGRQVALTVNTNSATKMVNDVNVFFILPDERNLRDFYSEIKERFSIKYKDEFLSEIQSDNLTGLPSFHIVMKLYPEDKELIRDRAYGIISVYQTNFGEKDPIYQLVISYRDQANNLN